MRTARALLIGVAVIVLTGQAVHARWHAEYSQNSPEIQQWFHDQKTSDGLSCCDQADGHRFDGNYEFTPEGAVIVYDSGNKYFIEKSKVLRGHNPTGSAVWFYIGDGPQRTSYCFVSGSLS